MNMTREGYNTEGWMAIVICIVACFHLTSGWTVLRTLKGIQQQQLQQQQQLHSDILSSTSTMPFTTEQSASLQQVQEQGHLEYSNPMQQDASNTVTRKEKVYLNSEDEGPLSELQMQVLQDLFARYLENGVASTEIMISNLVNQVEKRASRRRQNHKEGRRHRNSRGTNGNSGDTPAADRRPNRCVFEVNVPVTYRGQCTRMGGVIPACDFAGNSTHPDPVSMLWSYDCL